ncbi:MAG: aminoacyl-histidine dipeptidase [Lachnospiraceae bacterium]
MTQTLENLQPKPVFRYFQEICAIPHGSKNTKAISDYCIAFAKEHNLEHYQDADNNVIIIKEASAGYEKSEPVIIQGHLDMVCEQEPGREIDFEKEGLDLYVEDGYLKARKTTLGGDDGIAVAYALALLEDDSIAHPRLEVIFTVDEEIGMLGAQSIDVSMLKGHRMLNIDSDEEGIFFISCAGGMQANISIPMAYRKETGAVYTLTVDHLLGGHSGSEIDKERANAIEVMGRCLKIIQDQVDIEIASLAGGLKDNAIPRAVTCEVLTAPEDEEQLKEVVSNLDAVLKKEYADSDADITVSLRKEADTEKEVLDYKSKARILFFLRNMPNGIQHYSKSLPGLVETSLNAGILNLTKEAFCLTFSIRSSVSSRKEDLADRLTFLTEFLGGTITFTGDYPAWEYRKDSAVRDVIAETYRDLFGKEPQVTAIHAGLESGIFSGKIKDLDCVSFGPTNFDIHTTQERLDIASTARVWELIKEVLKRLK